MEEFMPQFTHVKMTHQNLMKNIEDFKRDKINILIATSVIEEGLDVSTCNLVISINEVLNVKSFIQTKGRARQKNSKFVFLCAEEEQQVVDQTIGGFKTLIEQI
jgi:ERCC4-related helicase